VTSIFDHYEAHLAPIYSWMSGGIEHALTLGTADVGELPGAPGYAVDLGAGFGMHSIPLARSGFQVLALDTSSYLLEELRKHSIGLQVRTVQADLRDFAKYVSAPADLILCMGDTLATRSCACRLKLWCKRPRPPAWPAGRGPDHVVC
jgi:ubiquinone/menaquinone biosynthesis C-methylase UbiE